MRAIRQLERATGSLEILIYLYIHGPSSKTQLSKGVEPTFETVLRTLDTLKLFGIVSVKLESRFPFREVCALTSAGLILANTPIWKWPSLLWDDARGGEPRGGSPLQTARPKAAATRENPRGR